MGIDARIEDENGQCIEELGDPKELVVVLLPRYDDNTSNCMRFIDPYGDTTFNKPQMQILINELKQSIEKASNLEAKEHGKKLLEMAKKVSEDVHLYLKFYGD
ncbi:hypothetical protein KI811_18400 [Geobacter hydrogenophilus]|uniref:Uncharacterized protein n=1 Tax=Geobacter hydrogenophilus TaxID=40983 RepID=A0A9W6FYQ2_9BACT|nr:hypothetical protein [Geobacter hydrogenophilus]MBT0895774.1 hypothetical protein [Geobacter hydrogenophilus]GLI37285.1 hypothetical protein GHYDROH2_07860 [Geobacter hydrogenophilus]